MAATDHPDLPVTVIGGYLGAGKTTLVNHLLRHADGLKIAVLVNDFGALPIDADLIEAEDDNIISIAGGCVCCSYGNDLVLTMIDLAQMQPRPDHVLIEASGVALPGAIASSIGLLQGYVLDGIIVLADAETVRARTSDTYMGDTVHQQLDHADVIVLNKTDLIEPAQKDDLIDWLARDYANAKTITAEHAALPLSIALGIAKPLSPDLANAALDHRHLFATASYPIDAPLDPDQLATALVADNLGIIRAKGFVKALDGQLCELQLVGRRWTVRPAETATTLGIVCLGPKPLFDQDRIDTVISQNTSNSVQ